MTENVQGVGTETTEKNQGAEIENAENTQEESGHQDMITKAEAQKMADGMLARKMKGMPTKEELSEFREWKESQKTEEEKKTEADEARLKQMQEQEELKDQLLEYQRKDKATSCGVPLKYAGYVVYEVSKGLQENDDFDDALSAFLEKHPEYKEQPKSTGMRQGTAAKTGRSGTGTMVNIIKENQRETRR